MGAQNESRGIGLILSANVAFTIMVCLIPFAQQTNAGVTTLFRFTVGLVVLMTLAFTGKVQFTFNNRKALFWRGFVGGTGTALGFLGITKLGIVKASLLINSYPLFATLFSMMFLKERPTKSRLIALSIAFAGVVLVIGRGDAAGALQFMPDIYTGLTLLGAALGGVAVVHIKQLSKTENSATIFLAQCLIGAFIMIIPAGMGDSSIGGGALWILVLIGLFAAAGQFGLTEGIRHVQVSTSSLLTMVGPVLTVFAGVVIFKEQCTAQMMTGAVITLGAIGFLGFRKAKAGV